MKRVKEVKLLYCTVAQTVQQSLLSIWRHGVVFLVAVAVV